MARAVRQVLPQPPPVYDQAYIAKLVEAVNRYIVQRESLGEMITARLIMTDPPLIASTLPAKPEEYPDTRTLPNGTLVLINPATAPAGTKFFTIVTEKDPQ
jgi:hypothetical protein